MSPLALVAQDLEHAPATESIRESDLRREVAVLTSDRMAGRLTGTSGNLLAGNFIGDRFAQLGLTPLGSSDYRIPFNLIEPSLDNTGDQRLTINGTVPTTFTLGHDFYPERFSASGEQSGTVVFLGFGITAPDLRHDDYGDYDVNKKIVLVLNHEPAENDQSKSFDHTKPSEYARSVRKAIEAQRRGAVAVLLVSDTHNHDVASNLNTAMERAWPGRANRASRYELGAWVEQIYIPTIRISTTVADQLAAHGGTTLSELAVLAESEDFRPHELDTSVTVKTQVSRQTVAVDNLLGLIEGRDNSLRHEWVIVGGHYDHEGATGTNVYHGADDNASGIAGILEIAEAFSLASLAGQSPSRSVLFAAWNAEERGLLGSWAYTEMPITPLSDTVAVVNLDMIGRNEEIPAGRSRRFFGLPPQPAASNINSVNILGYSLSNDLRNAAVAANTVDLTLQFRYDHNQSNLLRRSDQWPFLARGVPALFIHTGLHPDYHTVHDSADKLNYEKMTRIVQFAYQLAWNLSNANERPALNRTNDQP